jgi:hypothetical protein
MVIKYISKMKWLVFSFIGILAYKLKIEEDRNENIIRNPLSVLNYGDINDISWYGWFVIIYSFFVVIIVGSAMFLP